jgi:hypothetical protein
MSMHVWVGQVFEGWSGFYWTQGPSITDKVARYNWKMAYPEELWGIDPNGTPERVADLTYILGIGSETSALYALCFSGRFAFGYTRSTAEGPPPFDQHKHKAEFKLAAREYVEQHGGTWG